MNFEEYLKTAFSEDAFVDGEVTINNLTDVYTAEPVRHGMEPDREYDSDGDEVEYFDALEVIPPTRSGDFDLGVRLFDPAVDFDFDGTRDDFVRELDNFFGGLDVLLPLYGWVRKDANASVPSSPPATEGSQPSEHEDQVVQEVEIQEVVEEAASKQDSDDEDVTLVCLIDCTADSKISR